LLNITVIVGLHYLFSTFDDGRGEYFKQERLVKVIQSFKEDDYGNHTPKFYGVNSDGDVFSVSPLCNTGDIVNRSYYEGGDEDGWKLLTIVGLVIAYVFLLSVISMMINEIKTRGVIND